MDRDLLKITEIYMISCSFLVAALGTADTNPHRFAVSILGILVSCLWLFCTQEKALDDGPEKVAPRRPRSTLILVWMPLLFIVGWLVSVVIHARLWNQPLQG